MRTGTNVVFPVIAAMVLGPMPGAASAEIVRVGAEEAVALCPSLGKSGLLLGEQRAGQNGALVDNPSPLPPQFAPFKYADVELTPWSGQLAAVTYLGENPGGDDIQPWAAALEKSLSEAGWVSSTRKDVASSMSSDPKLFERTLETQSGRRNMLIELNTSGVLAFRCGDADLIELSHQESDGDLAPGSPRPAPIPDGPVTPLPTVDECTKPEILAAFNTPGHVDETKPQIGQFTAGGTQISDQKRYYDRVHTWLVWKLRESGQVRQERLWEIEESAQPRIADRDVLADVQELLTEGAKIGDTQDPPGFCKSVVALIHSMANQDRREIDRLVLVNRALEEEARRIGVSVDN